MRRPHIREAAPVSGPLRGGPAVSLATGLLLLAAVLMVPAGLGAQDEPMETVAAAGHSFAYHVMGAGTGTPLLLVNGGPGFDHQYLHLTDVWERFRSSRRVVFFDQPGTGRSSHVGPGDTISVSDLLRGMEAIRAALGVEKLAVLGHSWGGYVATAYAVEHPDRVERLVLVAPVPPSVEDLEYNFAPIWPDSLARGPGIRSDDPDHLQADLRRHLAMSFYSPDIRSRALTELPDPLPFNRRQSGLLWGDASARPLTEAASGLRIPVLAATGRWDANVSARGTWNVHVLIPGSRWAVWERSGHYPMVEEPDAFYRVVEGFLAEEGR